MSDDSATLAHLAKRLRRTQMLAASALIVAVASLAYALWPIDEITLDDGEARTVIRPGTIEFEHPSLTTMKTTVGYRGLQIGQVVGIEATEVGSHTLASVTVGDEVVGPRVSLSASNTFAKVRVVRSQLERVTLSSSEEEGLSMRYKNGSVGLVPSGLSLQTDDGSGISRAELVTGHRKGASTSHRTPRLSLADKDAGEATVDIAQLNGLHQLLGEEAPQ